MPAAAGHRRSAGRRRTGWGSWWHRPETPPGVVRAATFTTWPEEVRWIADQVVAARTDGSAPHWADIAVLTRRNADIGPLYAELTARDVPVEIVGLGGLLSLPEVMDVTATLRVLEDVTANPDLVRLLTGPRWRIGAARPGPARSAGARAGAGRRADRRPRPTSTRRAPGSGGRGRRRRSDRDDQPARCGREPGRAAVLVGGAGAVRPAGRRAAAPCAGTPASRCSTCAGGWSPPSGWRSS